MQEIIYLDNAATTFPKPGIIYDTICDFCRNKGVNPGRSGCDLAIEAGQMVDGTRKLLSDFFNKSLADAKKPANPDRLVYSLNATMGLNLIINGILEPGTHVITTRLEHNSVIRPINHMVKEGAEADFITPDSRGYVDPEDIRKAIRKNTVLVMVNHASNVTGAVQDIKAIGAVCREEGIPLAVDSAQTAGVLPIDMAESNISFLSFTGHKGLFGPAGIGGICVSDHAEIKGTIYGGTGVRSAYPYHLEKYPYRLEAGTLNLGGIAGLNAGIKWIKAKGMDKIYSHEMELLGMLISGFKEIKGVTMWGPQDTTDRVATLSVSVANYDPSDVGMLLDVDYGVQTRTGLHCAPLIHEHHGTVPRGTVRFSIGPFNTKAHIETTIKAVAEIAASRPVKLSSAAVSNFNSIK